MRHPVLGSRSDTLGLGAIVALALLARAGAELWGRPALIKEYDDGVYYRASLSLTTGSTLYEDVGFVHPPGLPVLLAPFSLLGGVVGDRTAFILARLAVIALSIVLVAALARLYGLVAGAIYATHIGVVVAGWTIMMEPLLDGATLLAVVLLSRKRVGWAGSVLGLALVVKLWAAVPILALSLTLLLQRRRPDALRLILVAGLSAGLATAPFVLLAPSAFGRNVVLAQLTRDPDGWARLARLKSLAGVGDPALPLDLPLTVLLWGLALVAIGAVGRRAWARGQASDELVWPLLAGMWMVILILSPTYWAHYSSVAVLPISVCAALAWQRWRPATRIPQQQLVGALSVIGLLVISAWGAYLRPWDVVEVEPRPGACLADAPPAEQVLADAAPERIPGCDLPVDPYAERELLGD